MHNDKRALPLEKLERLTSISDHPDVRVIAQELEKVTAQREQALKRLEEAEAEKEEAWHRAVAAMSQGEPTPEAQRCPGRCGRPWATRAWSN